MAKLVSHMAKLVSHVVKSLSHVAKDSPQIKTKSKKLNNGQKIPDDQLFHGIIIIIVSWHFLKSYIN